MLFCRSSEGSSEQVLRCNFAFCFLLPFLRQPSLQLQTVSVQRGCMCTTPSSRQPSLKLPTVSVQRGCMRTAPSSGQPSLQLQTVSVQRGLLVSKTASVNQGGCLGKKTLIVQGPCEENPRYNQRPAVYKVRDDAWCSTLLQENYPQYR